MSTFTAVRSAESSPCKLGKSPLLLELPSPLRKAAFLSVVIGNEGTVMVVLRLVFSNGETEILAFKADSVRLSQLGNIRHDLDIAGAEIIKYIP